MKSIIAIAAIVASTQAAAFINDTNTNTDHNGSIESQVNGNGEARGTANFTMSFSGSGTTKGDFAGNGMGQNILGVDADQYPYYYAPNGKH